MAGLLLAPQERVSATWSASYHLTEETSRFILSTAAGGIRKNYFSSSQRVALAGIHSPTTWLTGRPPSTRRTFFDRYQTRYGWQNR
jgi:hypothetical protein